MLKITTLPSGLRVATFKIDRRLAKLVVIFSTGRRFETEEETGISHFLEHILFTGTKNYPSPKEVKDSVESLGGSIGGSTYTEFTRYDVEILSEYINQGVRTLQEMVTKPLLKVEDIAKQKTIISHELKGYIDDPEDYASRSLNQLLWPNQQLDYSIEEELENIPNITRKSLHEYLSKHYQTSRAVICAVGNIEHEKFVKIVIQEFKDLPTGKSTVKFSSGESKYPTTRFVVRDTKRLNLKIVYYAPSIHTSDRYAIHIMRDLLSKRLREEIRYKRGLIYGINTRYIAYQDTGELSINVGVESGNVEPVVNLIFQEVEKMKDTIPTHTELLGAKARASSGLARLSETVFGLGSDLSYRILFDIKPLNPLEEDALFSEVSDKQVNKVAKDIFSKEFKVFGIGPEKDIKTLENLYGQKKPK